jgi:hypothetical protein
VCLGLAFPAPVTGGIRPGPWFTVAGIYGL